MLVGKRETPGKGGKHPGKAGNNVLQSTFVDRFLADSNVLFLRVTIYICRSRSTCTITRIHEPKCEIVCNKYIDFIVKKYNYERYKKRDIASKKGKREGKRYFPPKSSNIDTYDKCTFENNISTIGRRVPETI